MKNLLSNSRYHAADIDNEGASKFKGKQSNKFCDPSNSVDKQDVDAGVSVGRNSHPQVHT